MSLKLSVETTAALRRATQQHKLTLNTIVQGVWAILLARYSGKSDVVFGAVVSNRPPEVPGIEEMVGVFINTLPVRAQIAWDQSVIAWLTELQRQRRGRDNTSTHHWSRCKVGATCLAACLCLKHCSFFENYPMEEAAMTRAIGGTRDLGAQNDRPEQLSALADGRTGCATLITGSFSIRAALRWRPSLVCSRISNCYSKTIVADPARRLWQLPLLAEAERQSLSDWNDTNLEYAHQVLLHESVEAQVERKPEATAVVFEGRQVTYRELNERANQLANYLRSLDVSRDVRVGVLMDRSDEMLVALLAILKAGAAYVPLDPEYPPETPLVHARGFAGRSAAHTAASTRAPLLARANQNTRGAARCRVADHFAMQRRKPTIGGHV
jgi:hypothetical protein